MFCTMIWALSARDVYNESCLLYFDLRLVPQYTFDKCDFLLLIT